MEQKRICDERKYKMTIRCDTAMRRSKERANNESWKIYGIPKWKCTGECERCICGMKKGYKGAWEHNGFEHE